MKLVVLGNSLIQQVYHYLSESIDTWICIQGFINGNKTDGSDQDMINLDILDQLFIYLVRPYCRTRGEDYCKQIMATEFVNLGKGMRPTLAVLTKKNRMSKKKRLLKQMNTNYLTI